MRTVALTRKQTRVLEAVAAVEAAGEAPTLARIAAGVPLRPDLVDGIACDLCNDGLLRFHGEFPAADEPHAPGPEFRMTAAGHEVLSTVRAPA